MAVDPATTAVTVAQYGFLAAIVGSLVTFGLGLLTNRREKEKVADESVEEVLRERITLRDEVIIQKNEVILGLERKLEDLQVEHDRCRLAIDETRAEERAHLDEQP